jgi:hypothetical protein
MVASRILEEREGGGGLLCWDTSHLVTSFDCWMIGRMVNQISLSDSQIVSRYRYVSRYVCVLVRTKAVSRYVSRYVRVCVRT